MRVLMADSEDDMDVRLSEEEAWKVVHGQGRNDVDVEYGCVRVVRPCVLLDRLEHCPSAIAPPSIMGRAPQDVHALYHLSCARIVSTVQYRSQNDR